MKRSIIILLCSFVSAGILLAQSDSSQTPAPTQLPKNFGGPCQVRHLHDRPAKKTSTTSAKQGTSTTATHKATTATAPKTATAKTTTAKTVTSKPAVAAASKTATARTSAAATWITTSSGLKYQDVVVGKGPLPKPGDDVLVNYTGRFTNGKVFDTSLGAGRGPFELHLGRGEVIKGWDEGLSTMHVGESAS